MSRGLGRVQRIVLEALATPRTSYGLPARVIAEAHGLHLESVRRAMRSLARMGLIAINRRDYPEVDGGFQARYGTELEGRLIDADGQEATTLSWKDRMEVAGLRRVSW